MVPFMKLYLYYYFSSYIIKVSFLVFQLGIYNSFGKRVLVVATQKKGKDISNSTRLGISAQQGFSCSGSQYDIFISCL